MVDTTRAGPQAVCTKKHCVRHCEGLSTAWSGWDEKPRMVESSPVESSPVKPWLDWP